MKNTRTSVAYLVRLAVLTAILILMAFTPLGYLRAGPISITFLTIPVVLGAILLGPAAGAILGGVFGLTSFIQCFGMDWFGTTLFGLSPIFTFLLCFVPRILAGLIPGLIAAPLTRRLKYRSLSFALLSILAPLLNTLLFSAALMAFFGSNPLFYEAMIAGGVIAQTSVIAILAVIITSNAAWEAISCCIAGSAVAMAMTRFLPMPGRKSR